MVTIEDFKKLEIKIGKIKSAAKAEGTDKLLKLIFDLGGEERPKRAITALLNLHLIKLIMFSRHP